MPFFSSQKKSNQVLAYEIDKKDLRKELYLLKDKAYNPRNFLTFAAILKKKRKGDSYENSPIPSHVYIRINKHRKKVLYCFYKTTFPRKKAKLWFRALIKRQILTSDSRNLVHKACTRIQNTGFVSLKMSAQTKRKWHSMFLKIFQVTADEEMGK